MSSRPTRLKGKLEEKPHTPHPNHGGRYRCYISVGRGWAQPLAVPLQKAGKLLFTKITPITGQISRGVNLNAIQSVLCILHSCASEKPAEKLPRSRKKARLPDLATKIKSPRVSRRFYDVPFCFTTLYTTSNCRYIQCGLFHLRDSSASTTAARRRLESNLSPSPHHPPPLNSPPPHSLFFLNPSSRSEDRHNGQG